MGRHFLFDNVLQELKKGKVDVQILKHSQKYDPPNMMTLSIHQSMLSFIKTGVTTFEHYKSFLVQHTTSDICNEIQTLTKLQHKSDLWHEMWYGRITASKAYAIPHCHTPDGTLVETIFGSYKVPDTRAMKRGRLLESRVLDKLRMSLSKNILCFGLVICQKYPFISATPDGIGENFVVEIKCPASTKAFRNYIQNNEISEKCKAQVQLQMYATKKLECIFCVADADFEKTEEIHIMHIKYDENYVNKMLSVLEIFWKDNIFPKLYNSLKM